MGAKIITMAGGVGARNLRDAAKLLGACHAMEKPFTPEEARRVVRVTLED
ncbi:MAG: hypothetical protein U0236_10050 [Nitrospira sp.]